MKLNAKSAGEVSENGACFYQGENTLSIGEARIARILRLQGHSASLVQRNTNIDLSIPEPGISSRKTQTNTPMLERHQQQIWLGYDKVANEHWHTHTYYTPSHYLTSEKLRPAFYEMAEIARHQKGCLAAVTIQLSDAVNKKLRITAANKPASYLADRFSGSGKKETGWKQPFLIVLEESDKAVKVDINGKPYKRLHAHLLTICDDTQEKKLRKLCKRVAKPDSSGVKIKTTYELAVDYSIEHQWQEEEFGAIPLRPSHNNEYWLNRYREDGKVKTVLPVNIGWVNYMSKDLHKRFIKGQSARAQNFATFGLKRQPAIKQAEREATQQYQTMHGKDNCSTRPLNPSEIDELIKAYGYSKTKPSKSKVLEKTASPQGGGEEAGVANLKIELELASEMDLFGSVSDSGDASCPTNTSTSLNAAGRFKGHGRGIPERTENKEASSQEMNNRDAELNAALALLDALLE